LLSRLIISLIVLVLLAIDNISLFLNY
jgi:hypothetical protein